MRPRPENDLVYLLMILESIGKIHIYSKDFDSAPLFYQQNDQLNFNACLLLLANIGEQSGKISEKTKDKNPQLHWRKIKDFRNKVVHDYSGIEFEMTFSIIKLELPILKERLEELIGRGLEVGVFEKEDFEVARASQFYKHVEFLKIETQNRR